MNKLSNKISIVSEFMYEYELNIFAVAETWLLPSVKDSFVDISDYIIVRKDTESIYAKHGVCLYIRKDIHFEHHNVDIANVVCVHLVNLGVFIVVIYRPPSYSNLDNENLSAFILEFCMGKEVIVVGDFNLSSIDWSSEFSLFEHYDPVTQLFVDSFISMGLYQWVSECTFVRSGSILDLVFTSSSDRIGDLVVMPPFPNCGHCPLMFDYVFDFSLEHPLGEVARRAWWKGKYGRINDMLEHIDWDFEFSDLSISDMFERFQSIISPLVSRYIPLVDKKPPKKLVPPTSLKRRRKRAWGNYKDVRESCGRRSIEAAEALESYLIINREYRNFHINHQIQEEFSLTTRFSDSSKFFHAYLRNKKVGQPSVGPLRLDDGSLSMDPIIMGERFADGFSSVYSTAPLDNPANHQTYDGFLDSVHISLQSISNRLSSLDVETSMGPDGLHPRLLKSCNSLAYPLYLICQKSLQCGNLPAQWKVSTVIPLFKKGSRYSPLNYRPISLTSVCCKTLEREIADALYDYLDSNRLFSHNQYGFRRGRTVDDQLLLTYDYVSKWLDEDYVVDLILFDFAKAFDVVSHSMLINKLECLGVGGLLLSWITNFLTGRVMNVSVGGISSSFRDVVSGVPQGSVLGPLLFIIFVNHLPSSITTECKFFADDLKIYFRVQHRKSCGLLDLSLVQRNIDTIFQVASSWGLYLNSEKTCAMRFSRGGAFVSPVNPDHSGYHIGGMAIPFVYSSRDLGIIIDSQLKFHEHVRSVATKCSGLSSNILNSTLCRAREFMVPIYISHIRPILEFGSSVWNLGYVEDTRLLENIQRRWTKKILDLENLPYSQRLEILDLYSVKGRLLRADIIKCWKIFHGKCGVDPDELFVLAEGGITRGHRYKVAHVYSSMECRRRSFALRIINLWNGLPDDVVALDTVGCFKSAIHAYLGERLFEFD